MARHNHLIDWYYLLSSFVKLMMIESLKSFTKYLHSIAYDKTSVPKSHEFRHLLGCDIIEWIDGFYILTFGFKRLMHVCCMTNILLEPVSSTDTSSIVMDLK